MTAMLTWLVWLVGVRSTLSALRHLREATIARREWRARLVELRLHLQDEGEWAVKVGPRRRE